MSSERLSRRDFLRGMALVAGGSMLAACAPPATEAPPEPTKPSEEATSAPPEAAEPLRVSGWHGTLLDGAHAAYEEKFGRKVSYEHTPWGEYHTKMVTQMAAGTAPAVVCMDGLFNGENYKSGLIEAIDSRLDAADIDPEKWGVDPSVENGYNGQTLSVSMNYVDTVMMHVNMDYLDELGIRDEFPTMGTPEFDTWGWDKFLAFCDKLKKVSSGGEVEVWPLDRELGWEYIFSGNGPAWWFDDMENYEETECTVNSPACVEAMQATIDLVREQEYAPFPAQREAFGAEMWAAGKSVIRLHWPYETLEKDFEADFALLPFMKNRFYKMCTNQWGLTAGGDRKEDAWHYMLAMSTDWDVGQGLIPHGLVPPYEPKKQIETEPEGEQKRIHQVILQRNEKFSDCSQCTENMVWYKRIFGGKVPVLFNDTLRAEYENALLGDKTVQEAMDAVAAKINPELA